LAAVFIFAGHADAYEVRVKDARGNSVTTPSVHNMADCMRSSRNLGYKDKTASQRYCTNLLARTGGR
jgi:hypothetical protein